MLVAVALKGNGISSSLPYWLQPASGWTVFGSVFELEDHLWFNVCVFSKQWCVHGRLTTMQSLPLCLFCLEPCLTCFEPVLSLRFACFQRVLLHACCFLCNRQKKVSIRKMIIIRTARIPIIKLETTSRVVADISLGDNSGPQAANYIAQRVWFALWFSILHGLLVYCEGCCCTAWAAIVLPGLLVYCFGNNSGLQAAKYIASRVWVVTVLCGVLLYCLGCYVLPLRLQRGASSQLHWSEGSCQAAKVG